MSSALAWLFYWTGAVWWACVVILGAALVVWRLLDWVKPARPSRPAWPGQPARPHLCLLPSARSDRSARPGSAA